MSSIFAQLPNRLIMDIVKIRLDEDFAEAERKRIERETLFYWINRMSPEAIANLKSNACRRAVKVLTTQDPDVRNPELYRQVMERVVGSYPTKRYLNLHIKRIKTRGLDMDNLYSDQIFYRLRHEESSFSLTNATLRRRDNRVGW
jgi:hypothetical protein